MHSLFDALGPAARGAEIEAAVSMLAGNDETERGAVFTRPSVVAAILDLSGYRADRPLHQLRFLEPSFGHGEFLLAAVDRLIQAYRASGGKMADAADALSNAVRAVELHQHSFAHTQALLRARLIADGVTSSAAGTLCQRWLLRDDFLLCGLPGEFDVIAGNPPYVRPERIPDALLREYRARFRTMFDRADLYVAFYEKGLDLLAPSGTLGFICANRWMKNKYGGPLRAKIVEGFRLLHYIDMEGIDAFHADVIAYPAITVIDRPSVESTAQASALTRVARPRVISSEQGLPELVEAMTAPNADHHWVGEVSLVGAGEAPWLLDDLTRLDLVRMLEQRFPTLELAGCKVGIGVATGCDRVFIDDLQALPVEDSRKLPLVMARDLVDGGIRWSGKGVVNPFHDRGGVVDLADYPKLSDYFYQHYDAVAGRHVASKNGEAWFRTIDRIYPDLVTQPKLLVPDIKGEASFVLDEGHYYPHHNLYFITSATWDLRALQAVLRSSVTVLLVATYCTRMSGGFLRFQAQYLRRIRLPRWKQVTPTMREELIAVAASKDQARIDEPVFRLYELTPTEAALTRQMAVDAQVTAKRRKRRE
nr:Eco57I restriction-modification methylase domain-containing protein [Nitrosomonas nitrosa]